MLQLYKILRLQVDSLSSQGTQNVSLSRVFNKKKQSTKEVLEQIQKDVLEIEEYHIHTQQRQKRLVGSLVLYSIVFYLVAAVVFYFYYFPPTLQEQLLYATPFIVFPLVVYIFKRLLTWYYRRKISKNEQKLKSLRERKAKILEQVMETETYKVAKEILETYAPDQLHRSQVIPFPNIELQFPWGSEELDVTELVLLGVMVSLTENSKLYKLGRDKKRKAAIRAESRANAESVTLEDVGDDRTITPPVPPPPPPVLTPLTLPSAPVPGFHDSALSAIASLESRKEMVSAIKSLMEKNNYLLYKLLTAFRCAYCFYWNPARKQRPFAPRLETITPQLPPPIPASEDQEEEEEEEEDDEEEEQEEQDSSSGEDEEEEEEEEGGAEEEESSSSSSAEDQEEEEEGAVSSSELSSNKATSSQEGVCRPQQAGSLEDVAKSTPSSEPSSSDDHQNFVEVFFTSSSSRATHTTSTTMASTNSVPSPTSSNTASTTETEETE
ncbi:endoplasmic reticulum junction formation protein lunapark-A-like [Macrobrachium rosenbergii]|uniref:endoplasmic reticulum junction formation protein lunapark-A-like n=1 Tax=Macrobrachium rosenbergii TaxID=79674 RepID=UPI0034D4F108